MTHNHRPFSYAYRRQPRTHSPLTERQRQEEIRAREEALEARRKVA